MLEKRVIKAQVHCGLERPRVFVRLDGWRETVPVHSHKRDETANPVGVVALTRGSTKKRACERVLARTGARGGQRGHKGAGAVLCTIRCKAHRAATPRR